MLQGIKSHILRVFDFQLDKSYLEILTLKTIVMKRTLNLLLSLLIIISFSLSVSAQSNENELDQVKLIKQWEGTWESIIGEDSIVIFKIMPLGKGFHMMAEWKAHGKTYYSSAALMGLINESKTIVTHIIWQNGFMASEIGRFVSDTKMKAERFIEGQPYHATLLSETEFVNPDSFTMTYYIRGQNITWEPQAEAKWTFTRVKE